MLPSCGSSHLQMARVLQDLKLDLDTDLQEHLAWLMPNHGEYRVLRQSVDARRRHAPQFVYSVEVADPGESLSIDSPKVHKIESSPRELRPVIVGSGPAGLFAALRLVESGVPCILLERGSAAEERIKGINRFWRYGTLDRRNNVCYGEGGAGLYSDGKLITRIKSPFIPYVLDRLVQFGAPAEIRYLANPHVGSDKIRRVIPVLREFLIRNGCEIHFNSKLTDIQTEPISGTDRRNKITGVRTENGLKFECQRLILATGHSAEDVLHLLASKDVLLEAKPFAMGLRIEHPQDWINQIQYRQFAQHPKLGSANYKLTFHDETTNIGVYSFCMCPGGYVLSSGTEADGVVCNGMSNFHRNSPYANAALVVSVPVERFPDTSVFGGLKLRRELESRAFQMVQAVGGTKQLPAQNVNDFFAGRASVDIKGSSPSGLKAVRLDELTPHWMRDYLRTALNDFEKKMPGFQTGRAVFYGAESRTSSPVRVTRQSEDLQSLSHQGLYPCGEGAGYAGGITSAACDGIRIAEQIKTEISRRPSEIVAG